jgi:hypothetical protein
MALRDSVARSGSSSTATLVAALAPLTQQGVHAEEVAKVGFGRFPVAGEATYSHDWWFPRFGPGWRLHEGTDIFAPRGTPVRAPVEGTVRISNGGLGGLAIYVTAPDGTYFYLAHLASITPGLIEGARVATGDIVGHVGDSGNARGGLPHLHFEVHPGGGGPVDPKPVLDRLLADALAAAPRVIEAYEPVQQPSDAAPDGLGPQPSSATHEVETPGLSPVPVESTVELVPLPASVRPMAHMAQLWAADFAFSASGAASIAIILAVIAAITLLQRRRLVAHQSSR